MTPGPVRAAATRLLVSAVVTGCAAPASTQPVFPELGTTEARPVQVLGAWTPPPELLGPDGLGHHGWTEDDVDDFTARWSVDVDVPTTWISDPANRGPSVRVHTLRAPDVGQAVQDGIRAAIASDRPLHDLIEAHSTWVHRGAHLDELAADVHVPAAVDLSGGNALFRALAGVRATANPLDGPGDGPFDEAALLEATSAWPEPAQEPLARLVLAIAEAARWKKVALFRVDAAALDRIRAQLLDENYATIDTAYVSPKGGSVVADLALVADQIDATALHASALAVAAAVDDVQAALADVEPFDGGDLTLATSYGQIALRSSATADTWDNPATALVVDLGGDDVYGDGAATAMLWWEGASVVVDVRGDDQYGIDVPDLQDGSAQGWAVFEPKLGFTQGSAVAAVAVLSDGAGHDRYAASVHAQGSAVLGVGVLDDRGGNDIYRVGAHGQGVADFGLGILRDAGGDDDYRGYSVVQGVGKPGGHGLLLDQGGSDTYVALVQAQEPWLPAEYSAPNYFNLPSSWAYGIDGVPHYMSIAQGTGWGYRHEWLQPLTGRTAVWAGGFGALVDLGDGNDTHVADCMSMGQGFVYGLGMLYDEGGDDTYRTFWWGPGASAHMGVGLFWDRDGDDDVYTTRASSGFGYDLGVGWWIDEGGDDTYGGQVHYGRAYLNAFTYFLNLGGDDVYNSGGVRRDPYYGVVRNGDGGLTGTKLLGVFMDLGGGADEYNTGVEGPGNDAAWYHEPVSSNVNPELHKGIGLDR
jgi:hypothetical protein